MLFILCGAAGLRIGEALGLEIGRHISADFLTVHVRQKARHCKVETRLKTPSAERDVDLHPAIAALLKDFIGERKSGFLFCSRNGKPLSSSNVIRRHPHPALKELGYINPHTGTYKAGNHAFRRFRNTYPAKQNSVPGRSSGITGWATQGIPWTTSTTRSKRTFHSAKCGQKKVVLASNYPLLYRMYRKSKQKPRQQKLRKQLREREKDMAGERGFEPPTPWSRTRFESSLKFVEFC